MEYVIAYLIYVIVGLIITGCWTAHRNRAPKKSLNDTTMDFLSDSLKMGDGTISEAEFKRRWGK